MTAHHPENSHGETLAFVAAGFVHRLGNLIFTIQGHAQLLARSAGNGGPMAPIANAAERAGQALAVMRTLLGAGRGPTVDPVGLLEVIAELVRIPLRETGHSLAVTLPEGPRCCGVDASTFCPAVLESLRLFAAALPAGDSRGIRLELAAGEAEPLRVRIDHAPGSGSLPFPLATAQLRQALEAALRPLPQRPRLAIDGTGIELVFGGTERSAEAAHDA